MIVGGEYYFGSTTPSMISQGSWNQWFVLSIIWENFKNSNNSNELRKLNGQFFGWVSSVKRVNILQQQQWVSPSKLFCVYNLGENEQDEEHTNVDLAHRHWDRSQLKIFLIWDSCSGSDKCDVKIFYILLSPVTPDTRLTHITTLRVTQNIFNELAVKTNQMGLRLGEEF